MFILKALRKSLNEFNEKNNGNLSMKQINDPRFFTFNQINERNYHLLKGAKSLPVVMWFYLKTDREGNLLPLEEQRWVKTYTNVFHASQIRQIVPVLDADGNKIPVLDENGNQKMNKDGELKALMKK